MLASLSMLASLPLPPPEMPSATHGPYNLDTPGALHAAVQSHSHGGELILLHADRRRLRLLLNLIAELAAWESHHIFVLGFTATVCADLAQAGSAVGCGYTSYLRAGPLAADVVKSGISFNYVAWLQKSHLLRRFIEEEPGVNVLALDTDMTVHTTPGPDTGPEPNHDPDSDPDPDPDPTTTPTATPNTSPNPNQVHAEPYAALRAFRDFTLVTTFDFKGGFANANIGFIYLRNATRGGPVHRLLVEFERRIGHALVLPRAWRSPVAWLWDQNVFNKVLLSAMAWRISGREVFLPDGSDANWTSLHRRELRARHFWREPSQPAVDGTLPPPPLLTPTSALRVAAPWYPREARYLWHELTLPSWAAPSTPAAERVILAPSWLVSLENGLGHKQKHVLYGAGAAALPAAAFLHFTCVHQSENARTWPMRLFGHWHAKPAWPRPPTPRAAAASLSSGALEGSGGAAGRVAVGGDAPRAGRLLALEGGTLEAPLPPLPWAQLNALDALLGGAAALAGRTYLPPVLNCTTARHSHPSARIAVAGSTPLPGRCFWHVHAPRGGGVGCVYRVGSCPEAALATPAEVSAAARLAEPPRLTFDLRAGGGAALARAAAQLLEAHREAPLVLLSINLPGGGGGGRDRRLVERTREAASAASPALGAAVHRFDRRCSELTHRTKGGAECTNICS